MLGASYAPEWRGALRSFRHDCQPVEVQPHAVAVLECQSLGPACHVQAQGGQARVELHALFVVVQLSLKSRHGACCCVALKLEPTQHGAICPGPVL